MRARATLSRRVNTPTALDSTNMRGSAGLVPWTRETSSNEPRAHTLEARLASAQTEHERRRTSWMKVKNPEYTQTRGRQELFQRHGRRSGAILHPELSLV